MTIPKLVKLTKKQAVQPKLKKDGTPKKSGGARPNTGGARPKAGRPMKEPPPGLAPWDKQLERALRLAANNMFVIPSTQFFTKREIKALYGEAARTEFAYWFISLRRFDQERANVIRQRQAAGLYKAAPASWPEAALGFFTPEKYADWLIKTKCFGWVSVLRHEHERDIWMKYNDHGRL